MWCYTEHFIKRLLFCRCLWLRLASCPHCLLNEWRAKANGNVVEQSPQEACERQLMMNQTSSAVQWWLEVCAGHYWCWWRWNKSFESYSWQLFLFSVKFRLCPLSYKHKVPECCVEKSTKCREPNSLWGPVERSQAKVQFFFNSQPVSAILSPIHKTSLSDLTNANSNIS